MNLNSKIKQLECKNIITNDIDAWKFYKNYHHIYNKIWIVESQDIACGPMGCYPSEYPIIFKPIINLFGMSRGFKIIKNKEEYDKNIKDGLFWMPYLMGNHYCIDFIILDGKIKFYSCLQSYPFTEGTFNYHESIPEYKLPLKIENWIKLHFKNFTGCVNIEIIDDIIIEAHLRLNGDYHLYDNEFTKELHELYNNKKWNLKYKINKKYLIPIFVDKTFQINKIDNNDIFLILSKFNCDNVQFDNIDSKFQKETLSRYLMFDCEDISQGLQAKEDIIDLFDHL